MNTPNTPRSTDRWLSGALPPLAPGPPPDCLKVSCKRRKHISMPLMTRTLQTTVLPSRLNSVRTPTMQSPFRFSQLSQMSFPLGSRTRQGSHMAWSYDASLLSGSGRLAHGCEHFLLILKTEFSVPRAEEAPGLSVCSRPSPDQHFQSQELVLGPGKWLRSD